MNTQKSVQRLPTIRVILNSVSSIAVCLIATTVLCMAVWSIPVSAKLLAGATAPHFAESRVETAYIDGQDGRGMLHLLITPGITGTTDLAGVMIGVVRTDGEPSVTWLALGEFLADGDIEHGADGIHVRIPATEAEYAVIVNGLAMLVTKQQPNMAVSAAACAVECVAFVNSISKGKFTRPSCWGAGIGDADKWIGRAKSCGYKIDNMPAEKTAFVFNAPNITHVAWVTRVHLEYTPPNARITGMRPGLLRTLEQERHTRENGVYRIEFSDANWKTGECRRDGAVLYFKGGQLFRDFDPKRKIPYDQNGLKRHTLLGFITPPK